MHPQFCDPFFELIQEDPIDLARGALLIAREAYPRLDPEVYLRQLDRMAAAVRPLLQSAPTTAERLDLLSHYLFVELGFKGNQKDYYDPRNSYLNDVLERRLGIPITLSLVYLEVGQRLGLPLAGINFPHHFLIKCTAPPDPIFIDPFEGGHILEEDELETLLPVSRGRRLSLDQYFLEAVSPREILARMLRNLKQIHAGRKEFKEAISAGEKITWLQPDSAFDYRDLGYLYYQVKTYHQSLAAFREYLHRADAPEDEQEIKKNIQVLAAHLGTLN
jgi:regulator of sirC expression with transglutaminase-like and TPR domain